MKKIGLLFVALFFSVLSYSQVQPKANLVIKNATTAFGVNIPIGFTVYDAANNKYYVCKTSSVSTLTLTTGSANFEWINDKSHASLTNVLGRGSYHVSQAARDSINSSRQMGDTVRNVGSATVFDLTGKQPLATVLTNIQDTLNLHEHLANKSTTTTLGTSNILYPTQNAVKVYADAKVADAITDGVTTIAPSQNAVYDGLATKAPLSFSGNYIWNQNASAQSAYININGTISAGNTTIPVLYLTNAINNGRIYSDNEYGTGESICIMPSSAFTLKSLITGNTTVLFDTRSGAGLFNGNLTTPSINLTTGAAVNKIWQCTNATTGAGQWNTVATTQTFVSTWDANTNTPTLADGTGTNGYYHRVVVAGTQNLGSGSISYDIGDNVVYNMSNVWQKDPKPTIIGAALTKTDDTNVTLTLGGSPSTSLLNAASLTLGWTGTLADARIASASNWNTAYGWGNHASAGYLTSLTSTGNVGYHNDTYYFNVPNPIWSFANASDFGLAYYQGTALAGGEAIGFHFGNIATPTFYVQASGVITTATTGTSTDWNAKQATLVSGTSLKTVGGVNLLGSGDIGILGSAYGGTTNGFTKFIGPTTSEKTFTLPNANETFPAHGTNGNVMVSNGTVWTSTAKPTYRYDEILAATNVTQAANTTVRKTIISSLITGVGFISRIGIGAKRNNDGFGDGVFSVGLNDADTSFQDYIFNAAGRISSGAGIFALTSEIPTAAVTFNNSGSGDATGTTFNGSTAKTISYNSIGAQAAGNYVIVNDSSKFYERKSNKVTSISSGSTDIQYPSAKLLYDQLAGKQAAGSYVAVADTSTMLGKYARKVSPTFTGTVVLPSTTSIGTITNTELGYVDGVTSAIQTQFSGKEPTITAGTTSQYWRGDKTWQTLPTAGTGTVTSVAMSVPTGLSISGTPITTSGTLALSLTSGYVIPTTTNISNLNTAYGWGNHASAGYATGTINNATLTLATSGSGISGSQTFTANQASGATFTVASNATTSNTAGTIVLRDGSGYVSLTGTFCSSDSTLKRNIRSLSKIDLYNASKIDLRKFWFKAENDQKNHFGVIAQDVQKLFPELVNTSKETGKLEVNYPELSILLIAQQKEEIQLLKQQNQQLEKRIEKLEDHNKWEAKQINF